MELPHRDLKFTTTEDGVGIAFWEIGSGPPLIIIHNLSLNHAEVEWTVPSIASLYTELAARYRLVRFDFRGFGMSDNPFPAQGTHLSGAQIGMSTDAMGHDIAAVAGACGIDKFTLMAVGSVGPVGIRYAAEHPDIVSELILCDAVARIDSSYLASMIRTSQAIAGIAAETGQEVPITMWERAVPEDELVAWTNLNRQAVAQQVDMSGAVEMAQLEWDSEEYLAQIRVPALLLSARNPHIDLLSDARKLTAGIPDSQLRIVNGKFTPYSADRTLVLEAIADILQPRDGRTSAPVSSFRTIVFTDVVGSTEFVRRVGDEEGRAAIRRVEVLVSELAEEEGEGSSRTSATARSSCSAPTPRRSALRWRYKTTSRATVSSNCVSGSRLENPFRKMAISMERWLPRQAGSLISHMLVRWWLPTLFANLPWVRASISRPPATSSSKPSTNQPPYGESSLKRRPSPVSSHAHRGGPVRVLSC